MNQALLGIRCCGKCLGKGSFEIKTGFWLSTGAVPSVQIKSSLQEKLTSSTLVGLSLRVVSVGDPRGRPLGRCLWKTMVEFCVI